MHLRLLAALALCVLSVGCFDPYYGIAKDAADACGGGDTSGTSAVDAPTHDADIQPIWDANCTPCHVGASEYQQPHLDDGYTALVGVESSLVQGATYVVEGDPDNSYVLAKLEGTQSCLGGTGGQMPLGGELSADDIATIRTWIKNGAPQ